MKPPPEASDAMHAASDTLTRGDVVPGFSCMVADFFEGVPRDFAE